MKKTPKSVGVLAAPTGAFAPARRKSSSVILTHSTPKPMPRGYAGTGISPNVAAMSKRLADEEMTRRDFTERIAASGPENFAVLTGPMTPDEVGEALDAFMAKLDARKISRGR